jgi:hypothetical protein
VLNTMRSRSGETGNMSFVPGSARSRIEATPYAYKSDPPGPLPHLADAVEHHTTHGPARRSQGTTRLRGVTSLNEGVDRRGS